MSSERLNVTGLAKMATHMKLMDRLMTYSPLVLSCLLTEVNESGREWNAAELTKRAQELREDVEVFTQGLNTKADA